MIYELEIKNFSKVQNLVHPTYLSVPLQTVIEGTNPGYVYADDLENPEAAIVYHQGEGTFYFIGNPDSKNFLHGINDFMQKITEQLQENNIQEFEFSGDSSQWEDKFSILFNKYDLYKSTQCVYLYAKKALRQPYPLHEDFKIRAINEELLNQSKIKGIDFVKDEILQWWHSLEEYLKHHTGFVVMKNDKIVGRCLLDGKTTTHMAIGIAVKDKFQGKGIASTLVSTMINHITELGYTTYYECMDDHTASIQLSKKCGLTFAYTYKLFGFII